MRRADKFPETDTFHYHNQNPHNRITTDCNIRALSTATRIPYNQVVMDLAIMQVDTGYDVGSPQLIDRYLKHLGWIKNKQPRKADGTKYTGKEFCHLIAPSDENVLANIGGHHIVAIVDRRVYDIWDSTDGCIGNFWSKP